MSYSSPEIANHFLGLPGAVGHVTSMQLQRLVYLAHGWTLAITDEPLVSDGLEAKIFGPVFPLLYRHARYFGAQPLTRPFVAEDSDFVRFFFSKPEHLSVPFEAKLTAREASIIAHVWKRYGSLDPVRLAAITNGPRSPWFSTLTKSGAGTPISQSVIHRHFSNLAADIVAMGRLASSLQHAANPA